MNALAPVGGADLQALTRELNLLDRTRDDHVYQLGLKLIPIRQILQQMNGASGGPCGADGLKPRGWTAWCESAGLAHQTARNAIERAASPELSRKKMSRIGKEDRSRPHTVLRQLKRAWPHWTEAQQQSVIDVVVELARGA